MNTKIEALETKYREYADAYGAAIERGDHKMANRNHDKLTALLPKLRECSDKGEAALRRLMKDQSDAVAAWAATHSLSFAEADALKVLDVIAQKAGLTAFDAKMVARQWRKGELKIR